MALSPPVRRRRPLSPLKGIETILARLHHTYRPWRRPLSPLKGIETSSVEGVLSTTAAAQTPQPAEGH